jgi:uncharacterized membrane protein
MSAINDESTKLESAEPIASGPEITKITAEVTRQVITRVSKFFSGPLPPPDVLAEYNEAFQGAAERIVTMAESQLKHRQEMESRVVASNCRNELVGQIIGAVLSGIAILGGIYLAAHDKPLSGFGVILVAWQRSPESSCMCGKLNQQNAPISLNRSRLLLTIRRRQIRDTIR